MEKRITINFDANLSSYGDGNGNGDGYGDGNGYGNGDGYGF